MTAIADTAGPLGAASAVALKSIPVSFAYASSVTLDVLASNMFAMSNAMAGNMAVTLNNGVKGLSGVIAVLQDATGGRTLSFVTPGWTQMMDAKITSFIDTNFTAPSLPSLVAYDFETIAGSNFVFFSIFSAKLLA